MKEKIRIKTGVLLLTLLCVFCAYGGTLKLDMKKELELGREGEMFYSVSSLCEDEEENIYLLDPKAYKVRKFSKEGKELLSFGSKGEGPGEFKSPSRIYYSKELGIVVTETMNEASIFTKEGKPVKKINFAAHFGMVFSIRYLGNNIFYAEQRGEDLKRHQVLIDSKGNIVNGKLYTGENWEVTTGNGMRYMIPVRGVTPQLVFDSYNGCGTAATSDKYEVKLINSKGQEFAIMKRDVPKNKVTKNDKEYFMKKIYQECKNWDPAVRKKFEKKIPPNKMYFYKALPTSTFVYIFKVKKETTNEDEPYPVDVFEVNGNYLGEVNVPKIPLLMSDKYIYFKETEKKDDDEVIIVVKNGYRLLR